jgi:hypothetical protein
MGDQERGDAIGWLKKKRALASPGLLLTPPPPSSPKTPIRSYSAQIPPRNGSPTPPPPGGRGGRRPGRGTGGQNRPQTDADALRHPCLRLTAKRPSADDTTANQTTTRHRWCSRAGRESHDSKTFVAGLRTSVCSEYRLTHTVCFRSCFR